MSPAPVIVTVAKDVRREGGSQCLVLGSVVTVMNEVRNGSEIEGEFGSIVIGMIGCSVNVVVGSPPLSALATAARSEVERIPISMLRDTVVIEEMWWMADLVKEKI